MRQFSIKFIATISISQAAIQVQDEHDCYVRDVMYNYGQVIAQKTLGRQLAPAEDYIKEYNSVLD